tara:strand:- start:447 stop:704 length:258 start_codon:yes stop_codon:yes gene_type:complete
MPAATTTPLRDARRDTSYARLGQPAHNTIAYELKQYGRGEMELIKELLRQAAEKEGEWERSKENEKEGKRTGGDRLTKNRKKRDR